MDVVLLQAILALAMFLATTFAGLLPIKVDNFCFKFIILQKFGRNFFCFKFLYLKKIVSTESFLKS